MNEAKVSIIVLNWNGWKDTLECLDSIYLSSYNNYEVFVVDNGSTDGSADHIKKYLKNKNKTQLIQLDTNTGYAKGNNLAISYILQNRESKYIIILNNDTIVDKEFVRQLVKTAEKDKKIGIVGAKNYYYNSPKKIWYEGGNIYWWLGGTVSLHANRNSKLPCETGYVCGSALLIKTIVVKKIGSFDEKFFCYYEDADLSERARKAGFLVIYEPRSFIWHKVGASSGTSSFYIYTNIRNRIWYEKKYLPVYKYYIFLFILLFIRLPINALTKGWFSSSHLRSMYKGVVDGIS
jgi:hypothetical protein